MSTRESRDSVSRRPHSNFDRRPSPKRSRRDVKTKRVDSKNESDATHGAAQDEKPRQCHEDAAPLEALSKESDKMHNGHHEATKSSSDKAQVPRYRSYHQHDERVSAGKRDRRAAPERGWWRDSRDEFNGRKTYNEQQPRQEDKSVWRNENFRESKDDPSPPTRKRPAFRENKIPKNSDSIEKNEPERAKCNEPREMDSERREGKDPRQFDRRERPNRGERNRHGFPSRERERFNYGRQMFRESGKRDEKKWEHDLFIEANKSPPRRNEEEQIAEVEALLAS